MKKFVKVELGSRGEVESVGVIESSYKDIKVGVKQYFGILKKEEGKEYVEEFCFLNINEEKGVVEVVLGEDESEFFIDCDVNEDDCNKLVELFMNDKVEEFNDLMEKFW
jgi:hypothetical protein